MKQFAHQGFPMIDAGETAQLLKLAMARYCRGKRRVSPVLALAYFQSDRIAAGMGALKQRFASGKDVTNIKCRSMERPDVIEYMMVRRSVERWRSPAFGPTRFDEKSDYFAQMIWVPAYNKAINVRCSTRDFQSQRGRKVIAALLRDARQQLAHAHG